MSERSAQMVAMYVAGPTLAEVGEAFGVTESRICQVVRAAGIPHQLHVSTRVARARDKQKRATRARLDVEAAEKQKRRDDLRERNTEMQMLFHEGWTQAQLGNRFGISQNRVSEILTALGEPPRYGNCGRKGQRSQVSPDRPRVWVDEPKPHAPPQRDRQHVECPCEGAVEVHCSACGAGRCEDCAVMTSTGVRCEKCANAA